MAGGKQRLLEEWEAFRKAVERFQQGSNQPDAQLRAIYDQWIKESAEWEDARAAFSLYCRLNRLLNSDFINHLFERGREQGFLFSGEGAELREKDTIEVIGAWLLSGRFPDKVDLRFAADDRPSGTINLMIIKRAADGRFKIYNVAKDEVMESLTLLLDQA